MKKLILVFVVVSMFVSTYANSISSKNIPDKIKENFVSDYPDAEVIRWETTADLDFKVEFKINDDYGAAYYDHAGNFIEDDRTIDWEDVPQSGRMEIYHLGDNKIVNILKITNAKNEVFYQVEIKNNLKKYEILLNNEGKILRKF